MIYKHYRVQIVVRILLVSATVLLLAYLVGWTRLYEAWIIVGLALCYQVAALVRYGEKTARDLTHFLESVRFSDFTLDFTGGGRGRVFDRLSAAFTDVTEAFRRVRTEREEQYRYLQNVVQHVGVALVSYRAGGEVEFVNAAARRLLGIGHLRNVRDLASLSPLLAETLLRLGSGEQALVKADRGDRVLQLAVYVSRFSMRGEVYVLASIQDIGSQLEEQEMEAWQQLTRVLTHEIMNSVAPIASLASTAAHLLTQDRQEGAAAQDALEAVRIIERRSEALIGFVHAYRSFTQIPAPSFRLVEARALLTGVRRLLEEQIERKGITCRIQVEPEGLKLTADPNLIEQVLINLLVNAMQAVEGRPDPQVLLCADVDERGLPVLQVIDNGPGIPPEVQERIFVPFFTTKEDGSGIGLSLSRQIMRLHGGTLSVRSEPEVKTVFTLRF